MRAKAVFPKNRLVSILIFLSFFSFFCMNTTLSADAASLPLQKDALPSLPDLEAFLQGGPEVLSSLAALSENHYLLEAERQKMGPVLAVNATYGYNDEPITETAEENISYKKATARVWVSFPILGTWNGEKIATLKAELQKLQGEAFYRKVMEDNLTSLRKAYMVVWTEDRKKRLIEEFLTNETDVSKILEERTQKGFLLEADRLEFATEFQMAHRDLKETETKRLQALGVIRLATGRDWTFCRTCPLPTLPGPFEDAKEFYSNIPQRADLRYRDKTLELKKEISNLSGKLDRGGTIDVGVAIGKDNPGGTGTGAYVSATITDPFGSLSGKEDPLKQAAQEELEKERQDGIASRMKLEEELSEILRLREYAIESIKASQERVRSAAEGVREAQLRYEKLPGDTVEALQKNRYVYLRAALDFLEEQNLLLQTEAELSLFAFPSKGDSSKTGEQTALPRYCPLGTVTSQDACDLASLLKPLSKSPRKGLPSFKADPVLTAYVWEASPFLDPLTRDRALDAFLNEGFSRMLLSLNAHQLSDLGTQQGRKNLTDLLGECKKRGILVEALLGEPSWLLKGKRQNLLKDVDLLTQFPFSGFHLDIEPDSLPNAEAMRLDLAKAWTQTLEEVERRTPLPVSASLHPRYFDGKLGDFVIPALSESKPAYVVLMIYSSNSGKVIEQMKSFMKKAPGLKLGLAQSVEKALSKEESYARKGRKAFKGEVASIDRQLAGPQFVGVFVQSWEEYKGMVP